MKKLSQSGFSATVLVAIIVLAVIGVGLVAWKQGWIPKFSVATETPTPTPTSGETANWKTFISADESATFRYPENLLTNYIRPQKWPPKLLIIDNAGFSCEEGGLGINGRPGMTIQKKINNIVYCIESVSEETAGTVYTDYTYTFLKDSKLVKLSFTLAYPQCENYDNPQKTECEQERQTFDLDTLINRIAESVQL
jgi:hypothetical protein